MPIPSVGLVAYPNFDPFLFSIPHSVFTIPMPNTLFTLSTVSATGLPLSAGTFTLQPDGNFDLLEHMDIIIVPGWHSPDAPPSRELSAALIRAHKRDAWVVGLCYGAYVLAYTGLLDGKKALPKDISLFVQDEKDAEQLRSQGFTNVRVLDGTVEFGGVTLHKTECRHGSEAMFADKVLGKALGSVMGIVFTAPGKKTTYLAADTVWFDGVKKTIATYKPNIIILNTGAAAMSGEKFRNDPYIIMGKEDTLRASKAAPNAKIVAVHMDAINHMTVDRKNVSEYAYEQGIRDKVLIPFDGEVLHF